MMQTFCAYTGVINFISSLFIGILVLWRARANSAALPFAFFSFSVALWSFGYFNWLFSDNAVSSLFWARFLMAGAIFIPSTYFHYTIALLNKIRRYKLLLSLFYSFSFCYLPIAFSPLYISGIEKRYWFNFWPVPGRLFHPFLLFFVSVVVFGHIICFKALSAGEYQRRNQLRWVILGTLVGFGAGSTNYFLWYNVPIPPILNFLVTFYVTSTAYAIISYRLMDIDVFIRRTIIFSGIVLAAVATSSFILAIAQGLISQFIGMPSHMMLVVGITTTVLIYRPLERYLLKITDSFLFQKKFDYHQLLKDASRGIALIQSLDHLAKLIATFITMRARIKNAVVFIRSTETGDFVFKTGRGLTCPEALKTISISNVLIKKLGERKQPLRRSEFSSTNGITDHESSSIHNLLSELKAEVVIPSFLGREAEGVSVKERMSLRSLLFLGGKKSDEDYTQDDLDVFSTLAQESAIAIENARLYDEAVKRTQELQFINAELNTASTRLMHALDESERAKKELEENKALLVEMKRRENLERLAAAIGHELNNPLGVFALKRTEFKYTVNNLEKEITELSTLIPQDRFTRLNAILLQEKTLLDKFSYLYERMKAVASTVNSLIKAEDEVSSVSLRMVLDYSFEEVRFVTYTENLTGTEVELDVSPHLPPIRGNAYQLQAVFVNLIVNAYHAMVGIPNRKISISAKPAPDQKMVQVVFSDNGKGMPKDVLERCFEYRFTTKGELGTGIGLTVCKQTIERHGGSIVVESEPDHGTKFTILIPTWQPGDEHKYYKSAFDRLKEKQKRESATVPVYEIERRTDQEKRKKQAS